MMKAMRLDSSTLARLRDELRMRGARPSVPPPPAVPPQVEARAGARERSDAASPARPDDGSPEARAIVQRIAPMCEVLYLLMMADHAYDVRERDVLRGAARALSDGMLRTAVIDGMLARFEAALRAYGRELRLAQITAQLAKDRPDAEAAFMLAAVMAIADEAPDERERALLEELRELLGIAQARARELLGEAGVRES